MPKLITRVLFTLSLCVVSANAQPTSPLDGLDPKKIPAKFKPTNNHPDWVMAVIGDRDGAVDTIAFRSDGRLVAISGPEIGVHLWDLQMWKHAGTIPQKRVTALAFVGDGKTLAVGDADGHLRFWLLTGPKPVMRPPMIEAHTGGPLWTFGIRPDGKTLATGGQDGTIKLWNIADGKLKATLTGHNKYVRGLSFTPDGDLMASAGANDHTIRFWDLTAMPPEELEKFTFEKVAPSVSFSPDGKMLAASGYDGKVRIFKTDESTPKEKLVINAPRNQVRMVEFSPDGQTILGLLQGDVSDDVMLWDLKGQVRHSWKFPNKIAMIAWVPDGKHFATVNEDSVFLIRVP